MSDPLPSEQNLAAQMDQLLRHPARAETVQTLYQLYLGRPSAAHDIAFVQDNHMTVAELEGMLRESAEYRQNGRLLGHWARGQWDGSLLVVAPARMIFCPIAKVANTSVKHWVLRLLGQSVANAQLVHAELDEGRSPLIQARHHSFAALHQAITSPDWASVALLRDPAERLVSCYWDKFVLNRAVPEVLQLTAPAYAQSYGTNTPSAAQLAQGISFRAFCRYINANPVAAMDSHWAPQARYLETHRWDRLFALDQIDLFERFVLNRCPPALRHIRLGLDNVSPRHPEPVLDDLSDALPAQMEIYAKPADAAFLAADIRDFIRTYYAMDYVLLQSVAQTAD
jgi:hypothetical protein